MSAATSAGVLARDDRVPVHVPAVRVALLGTGAVGTAFLQRLQGLAPLVGEQLALMHVANSRHALTSLEGIDAAGATRSVALRGGRSCLDAIDEALPAFGDGIRVVVDATASSAVATRHATWLSRGINVVTACKIASGGSLQRALAVQAAARHGGASYGDSATVGAGLPVLRTIRELLRGGDTILGISGVLSGSLAWLLDRYDGTTSVGALVEEARQLGYTEPDPRVDLSGEDVRRKLLILARAAGAPLEFDDVDVTPLLAPASLAFDASALGEDLRERFSRAQGDSRVLRYVARWRPGVARVGLEALRRDDPLASGGGCDNRAVIFSSRYRDSPVVIQGPGAGPGVTAAALLDDVLRIGRPLCDRAPGSTSSSGGQPFQSPTTCLSDAAP